jgi:cardiolipin synthase
MTGLVERPPQRSIWSTPDGRGPYAELRVGPNRVALLKDGFQAYPAMLDAIAAAKQTVCFETYILHDDATGMRFLHALLERAAAGVEVLLMYDFWGSQVSAATLALLRDGKVKVLPFGPFAFTPRLGRYLARVMRRNHRKSLVVDGQVAFTGGLNISDDYAAVEDGGIGWRDTHVRIVGPNAQELERLFLETWRRSKGPPFAEGRFRRLRPAGFANLSFIGNDFALDRKFIRRAYTDAFNSARERICLTHAYFIPPARLLRSLLKAARRGVRVRLIVAAATDVKLVLYATRGLYPKLLNAGVEVYEWQGTSAAHVSLQPRVLHAKTAVVDGRWTTIGSSNLDPLSLRQNLEVNAIIVDPPFARAVERMFEEDLHSCTPVTRQIVKSWGWLARLLSFIAFRVRHWL